MLEEAPENQRPGDESVPVGPGLDLSGGAIPKYTL